METVDKTIVLPNVGKCDHTYLYHIVKNYDNLADITVFLPGSCDMPHKFGKVKHMMRLIEERNSAVFISDSTVDSLRDTFDQFQLDEWITSNEDNRNMNPESQLQHANIRPFGKWFDHFFGDIQVKHVTYYGIFSVSKIDILRKPIDFYRRLLEEVSGSSNPEAGHYMERSWAAVFHPLKTTSVYESR